MDRVDELILSHDELEIVCRTMMGMILDAHLMAKLNQKLKKAGVDPGFAGRSEAVKEKFKRERLMLMSTGEIQ